MSIAPPVRFLAALLLAVFIIYSLFQRYSAPPPSRPTLNVASVELHNDFAWYERKHPRTWTISNKLTSDELTQRYDRAVAFAKEKAKAQLHIKGIRGTRFNTSLEASGFRSMVDCWTHGEWIRGKPLLDHVQDPLYSSCDRKHAKSRTADNDMGRDAALWSWKSSCPYVDSDPTMTQWCQALGGRHMLLIGDLMHFQLHEMILNAMRGGPKYCFGELNCKDHTLCEEPEARMRYIRNDILSTIRHIDTAKGRPLANTIQWPFVTTNILHAYPILLLSRAPVANLNDSKFTDELIATMDTIRRSAPDALVLYRSTSIGHPYCDDATRPLEHQLSHEDAQRLPYGWGDVRRQNAMAREIVEAGGGLFIDLAATTETRPDGHVGGQDCLRYCIPGPLDAWIQILYNVLVALK